MLAMETDDPAFYSYIDNAEEKLDVYIPLCDNKACHARLSQLQTRLTERGVSCADQNDVYGIFRDRFEAKFAISSYTVLHRCPSFWMRVRNISCAHYRTGQKDKLICVTFKESSKVSPDIHRQLTNPRTKESFLSFFEPLSRSDISDEEGLEEFAKAVQKLCYRPSSDTTPKSPVAKDYSGYEAGVVLRHPPQSSPVQAKSFFSPTASSKGEGPPAASNQNYGNAGDIQDIGMLLKTLYDSVQAEPKEDKHLMKPVPDDFGQTHHRPAVYARAECLIEGCDKLAEVASAISFAALTEEINSWKGSPYPQAVLAKKTFLLHKVLPELYSRGVDLGLAHIASCNQPDLRDRALTFLELNILQRFTDTGTPNVAKLDEIERLLENALGGMRQIYASTKHNTAVPLATIERLCNILLMLHCNALGLCQEERDAYDMLKKKQSTRSSRTSKTEEVIKARISRVDELLKTAEQVRQKSAKSMEKDVHEFLDVTAEDPYPQAKSLLDKCVATQFIVIFERVKRIFSDMEVQDVLLLKECAKPSKANSKTGRLPAICKTMLFRGLALFLCHGLRSAAHKNIQAICNEVLDVFDGAPEKDLCPEVQFMLQSLLFDSAPVIRQKVIDLFTNRQTESEKQEQILLDEVERLLCPLLRFSTHGKRRKEGGDETSRNGVYDCCVAGVDQTGIDKALKERGEWLTYSGTFSNKKVKIILHKPKAFDRWLNSEMREKSDEDILHINQCGTLQSLHHQSVITMFAYQLAGIPQFYILEDCLKNSLQVALKNRNDNRKYFSQSSLKQILVQTADGLEYCHSRNIVHRNLSSASLFLSDENTVKLGGFHLAVNMESASEKFVGWGNFALPTRWSAPESLRQHKFSRASDVWMFGPLMYEVLTHGALPYSHTGLSDVEIVWMFTPVTIEFVQLPRETCIEQTYYDVILECVAFEAENRPTISEVKAKLDSIYQQSSTDAVSKYPPLTGTAEKSIHTASTEHEKGTPDVSSFPSSDELLLADKMKDATPALKCCRTFAGYIFREEVTGELLSEAVTEALCLGKLNMILPWTTVYHSSSHPQVIECHVKSSKLLDLMKVTKRMILGSALQDYLKMLAEVAVMLQELHTKDFVLGHMRASNLFLEHLPDGIKVYVVSLAHLKLITDKTQASCQSTSPSEIAAYNRSAPEVQNSGLFSSASDVYCYGFLIWEILTAFLHGRPFHSREAFDGHVIQSFKDDVKRHSSKAGSICDLMRQCISSDKTKRPTVTHIIKEFSRVISDDDMGVDGLQSPQEYVNVNEIGSPPQLPPPLLIRKDSRQQLSCGVEQTPALDLQSSAGHSSGRNLKDHLCDMPPQATDFKIPKRQRKECSPWMSPEIMANGEERDLHHSHSDCEEICECLVASSAKEDNSEPSLSHNSAEVSRPITTCKKDPDPFTVQEQFSCEGEIAASSGQEDDDLYENANGLQISSPSSSPTQEMDDIYVPIYENNQLNSSISTSGKARPSNRITPPREALQREVAGSLDKDYDQLIPSYFGVSYVYNPSFDAGGEADADDSSITCVKQGLGGLAPPCPLSHDNARGMYLKSRSDRLPLPPPCTQRKFRTDDDSCSETYPKRRSDDRSRCRGRDDDSGSGTYPKYLYNRRDSSDSAFQSYPSSEINDRESVTEGEVDNMAHENVDDCGSLYSLALSLPPAHLSDVQNQLISQHNALVQPQDSYSHKDCTEQTECQPEGFVQQTASSIQHGNNQSTAHHQGDIQNPIYGDVHSILGEHFKRNPATDQQSNYLTARSQQQNKCNAITSSQQQHNNYPRNPNQGQRHHLSSSRVVRQEGVQHASAIDCCQNSHHGQTTLHRQQDKYVLGTSARQTANPFPAALNLQYNHLAGTPGLPLVNSCQNHHAPTAISQPINHHSTAHNYPVSQYAVTPRRHPANNRSTAVTHMPHDSQSLLRPSSTVQTRSQAVRLENSTDDKLSSPVLKETCEIFI